VQLQTFIKNKREQGRVALLGVKTSSSVWHKRLGHPHDQILSRVLKSQLLSVSLSQRQLSLCLPCQVTKSRQLPFSHSQHVTTSPLELLHSDIWCSPVSSLSGCNYYVVFVDDFSRYSWFFPLIHKSEVLGCFIKLKCLLENQFSSKIKKLQTDGGGEYTPHAFTNFLSKHGIFHRISCPHTSQKHGIAERKHRHIVEMDRHFLLNPIFHQSFGLKHFLRLSI
jgi:transposase InsO family protein